jgi:probable rRNA maturation factor
MSPPRPETIHVQFSVEDGVNAEWDEARVGALVRAIIVRELFDAPAVPFAAAKADETSNRTRSAASAAGEASNDQAHATPPATRETSNDRTRATAPRATAPAADGTSYSNFSSVQCEGASEARRARSTTIALHLVSDERIRKLNAVHRGQDAHTDVLSFPLQAGDGFVVPSSEPTNLGDVVISYPRATEQAMEFGHSTDREVAYLVAHGVLHILGYDHEVEPDKTRMRQREEEALQPLGFTR